VPYGKHDDPLDYYDRYEDDQKQCDGYVRQIRQGNGSDDVILPKNDSHPMDRKLVQVKERSFVLPRSNGQCQGQSNSGRVLGCHSLQLKNLITLTEKCLATSRSLS
jgi:hypothetical protein